MNVLARSIFCLSIFLTYGTTSAKYLLLELEDESTDPTLTLPESPQISESESEVPSDIEDESQQQVKGKPTSTSIPNDEQAQLSGRGSDFQRIFGKISDQALGQMFRSQLRDLINSTFGKS